MPLKVLCHIKGLLAVKDDYADGRIYLQSRFEWVIVKNSSKYILCRKNPPKKY